MMEPRIEWMHNSKGKARATKTRSFRPNPRRMHACWAVKIRRKTQGTRRKVRGKAMKVAVKSTGKTQQLKNMKKIFMIFIHNFPENYQTLQKHKSSVASYRSNIRHE